MIATTTTGRRPAPRLLHAGMPFTAAEAITDERRETKKKSFKTFMSCSKAIETLREFNYTKAEELYEFNF